MNDFKYKVVYQWHNRVNQHPVQITAFLTKQDLVKLLNQPDIRLVYVTSNLAQSRYRKDDKPIEK